VILSIIFLIVSEKLNFLPKGIVSQYKDYKNIYYWEAKHSIRPEERKQKLLHLKSSTKTN
jgi:hypothetical protein